MLMASVAFMARSASTIASAARRSSADRPAIGRSATGRLFHLDTGNLPGGPLVIYLRLQLRIAVEGVYDKDRTLVAHRHIPAVALQREDHPKLASVFHRDLGAVIIERGRDDVVARGPDGVQKLGERHAFELVGAVIPWSRGGE